MQRSTWLAVMLLMTAAFMIFFSTRQPPVPLPKPEVMLEQARDRVEEAGKNEKKLRAAVKLYERFAGAKEYSRTEYAARARLEAGIVYETKLNDDHGALKAYKDVLKRFSPSKSPAAAEARERLARLAREINRRNSEHVLYKIMDFLVAATGRNPTYSYALALLIITAVFKVLTTPLSHAQFKSMREMQRIQPLVKQLQEQYKGKQKEMGEKLMALYKEHGVNPFASCLPLLAQFPILILLFKMVRLYELQFAKGHFLWIGSGFASRYPAFLGASLADADIPLLLLYTASMYISQKLTVVDPTQAEQQRIMTIMMPVMFAVLLRQFPSAFVLYWLIFNVISTAQQWYTLKQPVVPAGGGPTAPGGTAEAQQVQPPKQRRPRPSRRRRRRRRFDAYPRVRPVWAPT